MRDFDDMRVKKEELSKAAIKWLTDHKMLKKAYDIEEHPDSITFLVKKEDHLIEIHNVQLSKGSWSFREMTKRNYYR